MIRCDKGGHPVFTLPFNIANQEIPGVLPLIRCGRSVSATANQQRTIWTSSDDVNYSWPGSGLTMKLSCENSADLSSGSFFRVAEIDVLLPDYTQVTEVVSLNGRTGVTLQSSVFRINRIELHSNETSWCNTGALWIGDGTITNGVPANRYGHVEACYGKSMHGFYTVPAGFRYDIDKISPSVNKGKESSMSLWSRDVNSDCGLMVCQGVMDIYQTAYDIPFNPYASFVEKTDIEFRGIGDANDTKMSVIYAGNLVGSEYLNCGGF